MMMNNQVNQICSFLWGRKDRASLSIPLGDLSFQVRTGFQGRREGSGDYRKDTPDIGVRNNFFKNREHSKTHFHFILLQTIVSSWSWGSTGNACCILGNCSTAQLIHTAVKHTTLTSYLTFFHLWIVQANLFISAINIYWAKMWSYVLCKHLGNLKWDWILKHTSPKGGRETSPIMEWSAGPRGYEGMVQAKERGWLVLKEWREDNLPA